LKASRGLALSVTVFCITVRTLAESGS
jgi:hypothetical protein